MINVCLYFFGKNKPGMTCLQLYTNTFLLYIVSNINTTQAGKNQSMSELHQWTSMQIIVERFELEVTVFLTNAAIYLVFFVID